MAAVVGEDGRDGLQDFASVSPGDHKTEEAGTGQSSDGLSCRVIWPCAPDRGLQQQLEKRFWDSTQRGGGRWDNCNENTHWNICLWRPAKVLCSCVTFMWYFIHAGVSSFDPFITQINQTVFVIWLWWATDGPALFMINRFLSQNTLETGLCIKVPFNQMKLRISHTLVMENQNAAGFLSVPSRKNVVA